MQKRIINMDLGLYISLWLCVGIAVGFIISNMR
nr:MAG TPA: Protein of unknown function (DUF2897) [Caudoviricetes sp.]